MSKMSCRNPGELIGASCSSAVQKPTQVVSCYARSASLITLPYYVTSTCWQKKAVSKGDMPVVGDSISSLYSKGESHAPLIVCRLVLAFSKDI